VSFKINYLLNGTLQIQSDFKFGKILKNITTKWKTNLPETKQNSLNTWRAPKMKTTMKIWFGEKHQMNL